MRYPESFKRETIRRHEQGEHISALSRELHVSQSTLYQWRKYYSTIETPLREYTPKEIDSLRRHLNKTEHMLEVIHLSGLIAEIPLQRKLEALERIHAEHEEYSVYELCEAMDVSRGTFYNHIFRRADSSKREIEKTKLAMKIQQVFDDGGQRYGPEKIRAVLAESGIHTSARRIRAFMRELGLRSVRMDAKKQYQQNQQLEKKNHLERNFLVDHPNQVWVSDITYFKIKNLWLYLCVIIDLYARRVVGFRISKNASTNMVTAAFRTAYKARGCPENLTFHSDRGKQYTSTALMQLLRQNGVTQSFSATGRPTDNAVAEAFFASFKKEEAYRRDYTSERHFEQSVEKYMTFYNETRPHRTLKYLTPAEYEENYFSKISGETCSNIVPF